MEKMMNLTIQRKKINIISFFLISVCFLTLFIIPTIAHAATSNNVIFSMADQITEGVDGPILEALNSELFKEFCVGELASIDVLNNVYTTVKGLAGFIVIILAMSHMIVAIDKGQDPLECVFKLLIELGITFIFIMKLDEIIGTLCELGLYFINISGKIAGPEEGTKELVFKGEELIEQMTGATNGGFGWWCTTFGSLMIPWLMSYVAAIAAQFLIYQTIIEIGVRKAFTPFAVADIYQEGLRSPGVRYLKKLLAAFLKLALCVLVCNLTTKIFGLVNAVSDNPLKTAGTIIVANLSILGFMFKTGEFANDILGV